MSQLEASNGADSVDSGRAKLPVVDYNEIDIRLPLGQTAETDTAGCVNTPLQLLCNVTYDFVTMKTVTTRIPEDDEAALSELEAELTADRSEVLRRLIRQGLTNWRKQQALEELREHNITLRRAAEIADVTYVEMLSLAADEGIDTGYTTDDLERDLGRI